ncbi:GntR family transcriptional regulator [Cetobacterium sp. SF1]|uniref:GntR family transcriptional regulator n=1 Tax=unclassified Cetobacterium TaxID=2630983 RepID=UPI003CFB2147
MTKANHIEKYLIENIKNGTYITDQKIMSENAMSEFFGVSRMTARKAILNLISQGFLYQIKGSGTYVANFDSKININLGVSTGLTHYFNLSKIDVINKVIHAKHKKANPIIAKKLQITPGTDIFEIERIRYIENNPIIFETIFLEKPLFIGNNTKILENSLNDFLVSKGITIEKFIKEHTPYIPDESLKELFNLSDMCPLLKTEVVAFSEEKPIYFSEIKYNTNKIRFIN